MKRMKQTKKRLLAVLLAVCMIISSGNSMGVLAAETLPGETGVGDSGTVETSQQVELNSAAETPETNEAQTDSGAQRNSETQEGSETGETTETQAGSETGETTETQAGSETGETTETQAESETGETTETQAGSETGETTETQAENETDETTETQEGSETGETTETQEESETGETTETQAGSETGETTETQAENETGETTETQTGTESTVPSANSEDGIVFETGIYSDAWRTQLVQSLTEQGTSISGWQCDSAYYLGIKLEDLPTVEGEQYQIIVEMEPVLYIDLNTAPTLDRATVSYEQNDSLTANTSSSYVPKTYSLKNLTYTLDDDVTEITLGLPLRCDCALWNKKANASLGDGQTALLRVYLRKTDENGTSTVRTAKLQNATTGTAYPNSAHANLYNENGAGFNYDITIGVKERTRLFASQMINGDYKEGHYYKELQAVITLPTGTVNDTAYTMNWSDIKFHVSDGEVSYETTEENGILTITAQNVYYKNNSLLELWFSFPEGLERFIGFYTFSGSISLYGDGVPIFSDNTFKIRLDNRSQAVLESRAESGDANIFDLDTVQYLGTLAIGNTAAAGNKSGRLKVHLTFDEANTNAIGVTTVLLMMDIEQQNVQVNYTLVDAEGNPAFEGKEFSFTVANPYYGRSVSSANMNKRISRANLPADHRSFFFKTISYEIASVDGGVLLYHRDAIRQHGCAGTIWGYVLTDTIPAALPVNRMKIYELDTEENPLALNAAAKVKIGTGTTVSYGITKSDVSSSSIDAGDQVTVKGQVFVVSYPYSSNNCLNDIRLGLILPDGMTVNKEAVAASFKNGTVLEVDNVASKNVGTNKNFWVIEFKQGEKIGYANEKLGAIPNGDILNFSIQLNTAKTMPTQTLKLREIVFVSGKDRINGAGGNYSDVSVTDDYDLNGNNSTTDKIGCYDKETTQTVTINGSLAELEIYDSLRKADGSSGDSLTLDSFADEVIYDLHVECTSGGSASDFFYLIPIAKSKMPTSNNFLVSSPVSLKLNDAVTVYNEQGTALKVLYTTQENLTYDTAQAVTDWSETLPAGKTWEDVTMLKVVVADETEQTMVNGSRNMISVPLGYQGAELDYAKYAGMQIQWKGRGHYNYKLGVNNVSGHDSTEGCTVTLQYESDPQVITLTAAKKRSPVSGSVTANFTLPANGKSQTYSMAEITPVNVNLVSHTTDFSTLSSDRANTDFGITVKVNGGSAVDILNNDTEAGTAEANGEAVFEFEIYNADALSDIVTERTVNLTLIGNNGIIVPVTIIIQRELAMAEVSDPAIIAGKEYLTFTGGTSVTVSQDSAFTAQYVATGLIPDNYSARTLSFASPPASGTSIAMIDWTQAGTPNYYYYVLNGSESSVELTQFSRMGGGASYVYPTGTESIDEKLLFVVQLNGAETPGSNQITLSRMSKGQGESKAEQILSFTVASKRSFSLNLTKAPTDLGDSFTLAYGTNGPSGAESWYEGRKTALVFSAAGNSSVPADAVLQAGSESYGLNSEGKFIVPLDAVQESNGEKVLKLVTSIEKEVTLNAELWVSATSAADKPMKGISAAGPIQISFTVPSEPSYRVDSMSLRLLHKEDLSGSIAVSCSAQNAESVTLQVQQKVGAGYTTVTNVLNSVNGSSSHTQGIFSISKTGGALNLRFSEDMPTGTYRLLFTVSGGDETLTVPYNFIVAE